jgi:hypothetical protein
MKEILIVQPRQQLLKPRLHKTYLTISLTLKKSTIISRFVVNYKAQFIVP